MHKRIINSKNKVNKYLEDQFGVNIDLDFEIQPNGRVWVGNNHVFGYEINSVLRRGIYFGFIEDDGLRLSIEGTQLVGPVSNKNVIELDREEMTEWMRGYALNKDSPPGYLIMKY